MASDLGLKRALVGVPLPLNHSGPVKQVFVSFPWIHFGQLANFRKIDDVGAAKRCAFDYSNKAFSNASGVSE